MTKQQILDEIAHANMIEWDIDKFKAEFPTFYGVILEAMEEYGRQQVKKTHEVS